jgi:uncharacterized SAM-binding protein YcdF (DUF218 family)
VRRPHRKSSRTRRKPLDWKLRTVAGAAALVAFLLLWAALARAFAPKSNTKIDHFDAIIVLGSPADGDGNPMPTQLARVTEGVQEYERGAAPRIIFTGAAVANQYVEAEVMAKTAHAQGIPDSAIIVEPQARDTIQNACYSVRIMKQHGWRSAEVVSSPSHLPRAGLIFSHLPIAWRSHSAPGFEPGMSDTALAALEVIKTARYLFWARWTERCEP